MSSLLNRQPTHPNENALAELRQKKLRKYADVYTADNQLLGQVLRIRHRQEEVNPDLKLFEAYLEVAGVDLGSHSYIPVEFVADYVSAENRIHLAVPLHTIADETWDREPSFIAGGQDKVEDLA